MRRVMRLLLPLLAGLAPLVLDARPASAQGDEPLLQGLHGPYRGRVVELLTDTPLPGALVIMAWLVPDPQSPGDLRVAAGFAYTLTDADGRFVVDPAPVETATPPRPFSLRIFVYKLRYATLPRARRAPDFWWGAPAARFTGAGGTIELRKLRDEEERAQAFNDFVDVLRGLNSDLGVSRAVLKGFFDLQDRLMREGLEDFGMIPGKPGAAEPQE